MVAKVYEWLRAADLKPDDAMVTTRTAAAEDLVKKIRAPKTYSTLLGTVTAAVGGCDRIDEQSATFGILVDCVRKQQPAFPVSLSENSLHLRILCCLALNELLSSDEDANNHELLAASLLVAGIGLKPKEGGRHLDEIFDDLAKFARIKLQQQAIALRERQSLDWTAFGALEAHVNDPPTFNQSLLPAVKGLIEALQREQQADREELEVMWWLYNGYSDRLGKQLKPPTPTFLAATSLGCEIADLVAVPATIGVSELVAHAAIRDRPPAQAKAKTINKILVDLGDSGRQLLLPMAEHVKHFVRGTGWLVPLSWLCLRLEESQGASGWEAELRAKTGLSPDRELTPSDLAAQVFVERQAQRVYQSRVKAST